MSCLHFGESWNIYQSRSGFLLDNGRFNMFYTCDGSCFHDADAIQEFSDHYLVQVYSIQACIPKDPAVLWSAEFSQTEELFDQHYSINNCLRDNR